MATTASRETEGRFWGRIPRLIMGYDFLKHTMLRPPLRQFVIDRVKDPLRRVIVSVGKKIPVPTKENTAHPNSHILIDIRDKFFEYEDNPKREDMFRAALNMLIVEYEHDVYYRDRFNWFIEEIGKRKWKPRRIKEPHPCYWKERRRCQETLPNGC